MGLDPLQRTGLVGRLAECLTRAVEGSTYSLRGSLAGGTADLYSDVDALWEVADDSFRSAVDGLRETLGQVPPVESLRSDPDLQRSDRHRLYFARFVGLPLIWRLDLEVFATSIGRDAGYDLDNPAAKGSDWSLAESALSNAVLAVKWHLRGGKREAAQSVARAYSRLGIAPRSASLERRILDLAAEAAAWEPSTLPLAASVRELVASVFHA